MLTGKSMAMLSSKCKETLIQVSTFWGLRELEYTVQSVGIWTITLALYSGTRSGKCWILALIIGDLYTHWVNNAEILALSFAKLYKNWQHYLFKGCYSNNINQCQCECLNLPLKMKISTITRIVLSTPVCLCTEADTWKTWLWPSTWTAL